MGLLSRPITPVLLISQRLGKTEAARREICEYISRWPTPNTNLHLLVNGLLELATIFNRDEHFMDCSIAENGWKNVLGKHLKVPHGINPGTTLFNMSTTTTKYIGYYNHHGYPICALMGNRKLDLESGEPVLDKSGNPVTSHPDLDVLVQQGMIKRIPADDPKWNQAFAKVKQLSGARMATREENDARARTIATNMGINRGQADLPEGAEYVTEGRTQLISYQGRKFPSVAALNAFLSSQNNQ